jgi:hypothetical protein
MTQDEIYMSLVAADAILARAWCAANDPYSKNRVIHAQLMLAEQRADIARVRCEPGPEAVS